MTTKFADRVKKEGAFLLSLSLLSMPLLLSSAVSAAEYMVQDQASFRLQVPQLVPGDTLILANGEWTDFEMEFFGDGTENAPIELRAEEKGKVRITGQSFLKLSGSHLVVRGLVFTDGYTPINSVISFRRDSDNLASHTRVTETVIDGFSNPERTETDFWVLLYGRHNRFDHNHLAGKGNRGVTMAVRLDTEESRENFHRIDHNYFGPRTILGSNGGETLRVGTSHYSLFDSNTLVEYNYFDRCDGELEIISSKSGNNIYRGNVFFESRGTLTLRHGNGNLVEDNVFFGNGVEHTGGIRVINAKQTIRNNYMEGLAGYRFGGALVVMNGVPDSPINRYHQVDSAVIENNSIVESDHIQLAAGSDEERSAVPTNSRFRNNLIFNADAENNFTVYDDISGIDFDANVLFAVQDPIQEEGFLARELTMSRADNGLLYPEGDDAGVSRSLAPISKAETGVAWHPKSALTPVFGGGNERPVSPGAGSLFAAISGASDGDSLVLAPGLYTVERILAVDKALSIVASEEGAVEILFERSSLFEIQEGGNLLLRGLEISGESAPDSAGNALIRTQYTSMLMNYELVVENSIIRDLDINHSFDFLKVSKSTFASKIRLADSRFENITGSVLRLSAEPEDLGVYNAEYVEIADSTFTDVQGALVDLYRGGNDESTFGPHLSLTNSALSRVGLGSRNKREGSLFLHGVQVTNIEQSEFSSSAPIVVEHTVAEPRTRVINNRFVDVTPIKISELNSVLENTANLSGNIFSE